jgi:valyl-tRNA synthetase
MAKIGRPPLFKTPEQMQKKIDEYFDKICGIEFFKDDETGKIQLDNNKKPIILSIKPPTVTGLALHLGFSDRHSLYDYEKRKDDKEIFAHIIKRARTRVENYLEEKTTTEGKAGQIFLMKNHGWTDKQEIEHLGNKERPLTINIQNGGNGSQ